jgi:hypothetical protein
MATTVDRSVDDGSVVYAGKRRSGLAKYGASRGYQYV